MTRLSVVLTNYNHGQFLRDRIRSILSQISSDDELVIIDDASTDDSLEIIKEFTGSDPRTRLIKNEKNLGPARAANKAIESAKGVYMTWLAADDRLLPGFVGKTMALLSQHPEIGLCCSDCARWYDGFPDKDQNQIYTDKLLPDEKAARVFQPRDMVGLFWTTHFWVPSHTAIMKRDLVLKFGGFENDLGPFCDWFLLHTIALHAGAAYIPEELAVWRQDVKSYSGNVEANPVTKRKYQMSIFDVLSQRNDLRAIFKRSGILHYHIRSNLAQLLLKPRYWDFLFSFAQRYLAFRRRK